MRRIAELDGVRGLAAAAIVAYHMFQQTLPLGWVALDVFFVLSGYLITAIVLEHGSSPRFLPAFYARRGLRIWPLYYLMLLTLVVIWPGERAAIPYYLTYTQETPRYWHGALPSWYGMRHTWTLALEEQFYLFWPALLLVTGRRWTAPLALVLAVGSIAARSAGLDPWTLAARCDGFALGGFLAALLADSDVARGQRRALGCALAAGLAALVLCGTIGKAWPFADMRGAVEERFYVSVASLASFAVVTVIVRLAGHPSLFLLRTSPLVALGTMSYGIYLLHIPVIKSLSRIWSSLGLHAGPALWTIQVLLVVATAAISWRLIEQPILRLKNVFPYTAAEAERSVNQKSSTLADEALAVSGA